MTALTEAPKNILVPVDFSEPSEHAISAACALALKTGATVHLLHAYSIPMEPAGPTPTPSQHYVEQFVKESRGKLEALAAKLGKGAAFGPFLVESGDPRDVILAQAKKLQAEMIVVGTHGRRGITRALIGSVTESVVRTAPVSVLVVR
jgi:nucleotide-binding universal stress UspA family protein